MDAECSRNAERDMRRPASEGCVISGIVAWKSQYRIEWGWPLNKWTSIHISLLPDYATGAEKLPSPKTRTVAIPSTFRLGHRSVRLNKALPRLGRLTAPCGGSEHWGQKLMWSTVPAWLSVISTSLLDPSSSLQVDNVTCTPNTKGKKESLLSNLVVIQNKKGEQAPTVYRYRTNKLDLNSLDMSIINRRWCSGSPPSHNRDQ